MTRENATWTESDGVSRERGRSVVISKSGSRRVFSLGPSVQFSPGLGCVSRSLVYRDHEGGHFDFFLTKSNPPGV